jgi:hypothetical protein
MDYVTGRARPLILPRLWFAKSPLASKELTFPRAHLIFICMFRLLFSISRLLIFPGCRRELVLENLALRQQLAVWKRQCPRPRLRPCLVSSFGQPKICCAYPQDTWRLNISLRNLRMFLAGAPQSPGLAAGSCLKDARRWAAVTTARNDPCKIVAVGMAPSSSRPKATHGKSSSLPITTSPLIRCVVPGLQTLW